MEMYKELLNQIIYYHSNVTLCDKFNSMIFQCKEDIPVLIIGDKIFEIGAEFFSTEVLDSLEFNQINLRLNSCEATNELISCLYCHEQFRKNNHIVCNDCFKRTGEIITGYIVSQIPINFEFRRDVYGVRKLNSIRYVCDKTGLRLLCSYDTNSEIINFGYCKNLSELPATLYNTCEYPLKGKGLYICKICGDSCGEWEIMFKEENENVMCDDCREIFKYRLQLEIIPIIMCLNYIEFENNDIRLCIKKSLF
jgi:hypothetical protein